MGILRFKDGITLRPDPAGARLLGAIERITRTWHTDIWITAGSDSHGATDPHTLGRAFDVRTHGMQDPEKTAFLHLVLVDLMAADETGPGEQTLKNIWYAANTRLWFGQVENHGLDTEHIHLQLRNVAVFPPVAAPPSTTTRAA